MDLVSGLVATPFREIVDKAAAAVQNAGDDKDMLVEGQKLGRGADRILKAIEPLCDRLLADHGAGFIDALKENNEIAGFRSRLDSLLYDFDDVITVDGYDRSKFIELQALCKEAGLEIREILMRMKLEPVAREPFGSLSPTSTYAAQMPGQLPSLSTLSAVEEPEYVLASIPAPEPELMPSPPLITPEPRIEEPSMPPPPPPPDNPWEIRMPPPVDIGAEDDISSEAAQRRRSVPAVDSPVEHLSPVVSPASPEVDRDRRTSFTSPRRLDIGVDHMMQEYSERCHLTVSPDLIVRPTTDTQSASTERSSPSTATERASFSGRARSSTGTIPEEHALEDAEAPPFVGATILPSHVYHRYSQTSNHSSDHSHPSRQRSQESLHSSVFDGRRESTASPTMTDHRASISSMQPPEDGLSRGPTIPANFPPGVHDGIEAVPVNQSEYSELIPVDETVTDVGVVASPPLKEQDCNIGLSSSFYLFKGFCEGAKDVMRGGIGIKKTKKPGFAGMHIIARCSHCFYETDYQHVEKDVKNSEEANYHSQGIGYRVRFLQKSHIATKRADETLYGCVFCIEAQATTEPSDATVFFTQRALFEHLARHPRPLPHVKGVAVVDGGEVPFNLRNNYDLHFKVTPARSPLAGSVEEVAAMATGRARTTVKKMYGMRMLGDRTPAFELAEGARIVGIEFPAKYGGEWAMGWHDGEYKSVPIDVLRLEVPGRGQVRMGAASGVEATAKWRFAPKGKDIDWLRFEKGEAITNITWSSEEHWCWSGGDKMTLKSGLTGAEIAKHNDAKSCWVIVHGKAYDVTEFLPEHPGGQKIILKYAGKDATEEYEPIHPPDTLDKYLDKSKHLGPVDMASVVVETKEEDPDEVARQERFNQRPLLEQCYNLMDFEAVARRVMKKTAWGYYSSAADDEITLRENHAAFHRIWFRPRILVDVEKVDFSTTMLGTKVDMPFYVTATALGKLGHPEGEVLLTRAAAKHNVIQMIPTLASCAFDEMLDAAAADQVQWLQLYVNKDRAITRKIVEHAEKRGCKGLFITVDAPQLGRREKDMRSKFTDPGSNVQSGQATDTSQGAARAISTFIDPALSWKDIPWFQSITKMPIILKGVQRVEDVLRAIEAGVQGVVLSNHGGRQLDFARSGIEVLAETMAVLREQGLENKIEIFIDGGVRRATDIIKALCLGAKGVGIGRPFLYAMAGYGFEGVDRAMQLLREEMEMNMRLIGCTSIDQLNPSLVDVRSLYAHGNGTPGDNLAGAVYDPLATPVQRPKAPKSSKL
ncbi:hypothetical protein ACHAQH_005639 [Verticillium albo-atrum]